MRHDEPVAKVAPEVMGTQRDLAGYETPNRLTVLSENLATERG